MLAQKQEKLSFSKTIFKSPEYQFHFDIMDNKQVEVSILNIHIWPIGAIYGPVTECPYL